jgi:hypothetical protein
MIEGGGMAAQDVHIAGSSFWAGRDKLGRHVRARLSQAEADLEVALWDIEITEMEQSSEEVVLARIEASGVSQRLGMEVRFTGFICAPRTDEEKLPEMVATLEEASDDLKLLEQGSPASGW